MCAPAPQHLHRLKRTRVGQPKEGQETRGAGQSHRHPTQGSLDQPTANPPPHVDEPIQDQQSSLAGPLHLLPTREPQILIVVHH